MIETSCQCLEKQNGHDRGGAVKSKLELPDPAHFYEVALEVPQLRVGFADLVGKRDLRD